MKQILGTRKQVHVSWEIHRKSILPAQDCKIPQKARHFIVFSEIISLLLSSLISFLGAQNVLFWLPFKRGRKGRYTRGSLLSQHAPATRSRSRAASSAPTISSEKICSTTKLLLPSFTPSYQTGPIWGSKLQGQICCTSLFQEQAPSCALKFAHRDMTCPLFF